MLTKKGAHEECDHIQLMHAHIQNNFDCSLCTITLPHVVVAFILIPVLLFPLPRAFNFNALARLFLLSSISIEFLWINCARACMYGCMCVWISLWRHSHRVTGLVFSCYFVRSWFVSYIFHLYFSARMMNFRTCFATRTSYTFGMVTGSLRMLHSDKLCCSFRLSFFYSRCLFANEKCLFIFFATQSLSLPPSQLVLPKAHKKNTHTHNFFI